MDMFLNDIQTTNSKVKIKSSLSGKLIRHTKINIEHGSIRALDQYLLTLANCLIHKVHCIFDAGTNLVGEYAILCQLAIDVYRKIRILMHKVGGQ